MTGRLIPALALAVLLMGPGAAQARDWSAQITPYLWGAGIGGFVTPLRGGPRLQFDEGLRDVLEDLDSAFFLSAYARTGRLVLLGDISASSSSRSGFVPGPGPPVRGAVDQRSITLAAGYRLHNTEGAALDVLAGLRHWRIEAAAKTPVPGLAAGLDIDFTDPILALRGNVALADRWSLIGYADFGGFGVGSDLTAQLVATLNWQARDALFLSFGYRHLLVDYDSDGRGADVTFAGPLLGLTYQF